MAKKAQAIVTLVMAMMKKGANGDLGRSGGVGDIDGDGGGGEHKDDGHRQDR